MVLPGLPGSWKHVLEGLNLGVRAYTVHQEFFLLNHDENCRMAGCSHLLVITN
jgi:hypothetical protein